MGDYGPLDEPHEIRKEIGVSLELAEVGLNPAKPIESLLREVTP